MLTRPGEYLTLVLAFAPLFSKRIWNHIQVLLLGAILTPSQRTVTAVLRIRGLSQVDLPKLPSAVLERLMHALC